ncbi:hypothetical protein FHU14_000077 [Mesorhizobium sp. RMAD-H1]|nr:hypothetical protein [Mesorhizobium sp. RMAD-H1]
MGHAGGGFHEEAAQGMPDRPGTYADKGEFRPAKPRRQTPSQDQIGPAEGRFAEIIEDSRAGYDDHVEFSGKADCGNKIADAAGHLHQDGVDPTQEKPFRPIARDCRGVHLIFLTYHLRPRTDAQQSRIRHGSPEKQDHGFERAVISRISGAELSEEADPHSQYSRENGVKEGTADQETINIPRPRRNYHEGGKGPLSAYPIGGARYLSLPNRDAAAMG